MSDEQVRQLNRKMDKVLAILHNDDDTGKPGLVAEVTEIRNKFVGFVAQYNIDQAVRKGKDTVWRIVWGAVGAFLLLVAKFLGAIIIK